MSSLDEELERYREAHGGRFSPNEFSNNKTDLKSTLGFGEKIIWQGEGEYSKELKKINNTVPKFFAGFWLGFSIFWTLSAFLSGGGFFALFGVPFIIIGIMLFKTNKLRPQYMLTNTRIVTRINGRDYFTRLESIANANLNMRADGKGDIYYSACSDFNENLTPSGGFMNGIDDAQNVYTLFENAVFDSQKNKQ